MLAIVTNCLVMTDYVIVSVTGLRCTV